MEKKKKREKSLANGCAADGQDFQNVDAQRETENSSKRLAASDGSAQPMLPSFNWLIPQHPSVQPQPAYTLMPQVPWQAPHLQPTLQGQQGAPQSAAAGSQLWQSLDATGQQHHPFHSTSGDANWPQTPTGAQGVTARLPPFNFPVPPFAAPWDPWWGHNHYQPPFPHFFPGFGNGYPYPLPPVPLVGTNQRGLIKPPPGLSQKHVRMWEVQSMENMQLWTTTTQLWAAVARADAEIALQRSKIIKLEADLQAMKENHDDQIPRTDATIIPRSVLHRGRRKKSTASTPTVSGSPDSSLQLPHRKAKANLGKVAFTKRTESDFEVKEKYTIAIDHKDHTVDISKNENGFQKSPQKNNVLYQVSTNDVLTAAKDEMSLNHASNHISHNHFRPSILPVTGKDNSFDRNLGMKEGIVNFLKNADNMDHHGHGVMIGDSSFMVAMNNAIKDSDARVQLQRHYNNTNDELTKTLNLGKVIAGWQYIGEDGSEQDETVASARDEDPDNEADDEPDLDGINTEKVSNCMVLDPLSMKWQ